MTNCPHDVEYRCTKCAEVNCLRCDWPSVHGRAQMTMTSRYCVPCGTHAYVHPRPITIAWYVRRYLAGRLSPSYRRLIATAPYLLQGYAVTNRHDEKRWLKLFDECVSVACDALEDGKAEYACEVLDQLLPHQVTNRLVSRPVYGDSYVGAVAKIRHELVLRGRLAPSMRAKVTRIVTVDGANLEQPVSVAYGLRVGDDAVLGYPYGQPHWDNCPARASGNPVDCTCGM